MRKKAVDILDLIAISEVSRHSRTAQIKNGVLQVLALVDSCKEALLVEARRWPARSVEEPAHERIIQGPREGFTVCRPHQI